MGYPLRGGSTKFMILCFAIIMIGGAFAMYEVCTQTYTAKEKPCINLCKEVEKNNG